MPKPNDGIRVANIEKTIILLLILFKIVSGQVTNMVRLFEVQQGVDLDSYSFDSLAIIDLQ